MLSPHSNNRMAVLLCKHPRTSIECYEMFSDARVNSHSSIIPELTPVRRRICGVKLLHALEVV